MNHVKTSRVGGPPPRVQLPPGTLPVRAIVLCLGGRWSRPLFEFGRGGMKHEIYARVQGFNDEHHGKSETRRIRYTCLWASFGISVHMADTSLDKDAQTNIHKPGVSDTPGLWLPVMLMMLRCFSSVPHYIYMTIQQQIQQAHMFMTSTSIEETKQIMQAALFCLWDTSWAPLMASTLVQLLRGGFGIRCNRFNKLTGSWTHRMHRTVWQSPATLP